MSMADARLAELAVQLPVAATPVANYVAARKHDKLVHISGQLSLDSSGGIKGIVGDNVSLERAVDAAKLCALNLIAQMKAAANGDLDRVTVLKLGVFLQVCSTFGDIPLVANGCSDLMVAVFGERGRHARSAVGVYRLPLDCAVEVDALIALD